MKYKDCCIVSESGDYVDFVLGLLSENSDYQVRGDTLRDGETLVCAEPPIKRPYAGAAGFISPKWDGSAWTEGATAEEIAAWEAEHPTPEHVISPPSQLDSIEAQATYTAMMTNTLLEG